MKRIILALLCILFLIIDNTLLPFLAINTYYPSTLLIFAICFSIVSDKWEAVYIGVFSGILQDIYFFHGFGVNALINMIICIIAAFVGESIFKEKKLIPVLASFALVFVKYILLYVVLYIFEVKISLQGLFYIGASSMLLTFFMYKWIYKLSQKEYMKKNWKFNE